MRKKLLIIVSALMMLFGSALTVSAGNLITEPDETYYYIKNEIKSYSSLYSEKYVHYEYLAEVTTNVRVAGYIRNDADKTKWLVVTCYDTSKNNSYTYDLEYTSCEVINQNGYDSYEPVKIGKSDSSFLFNCEYAGSSYHNNLSFAKSCTNIPYFATVEEMNHYLITGDLTGNLNLNDSYENMTDDDSFGLTGFQADNTITATWTGTTHDDVIDTYNKAKVGIRPGYAYKSAPGQIAVRSTVLQEYDIADKTFTKLYEELKPSDDTLFLRYLEVIPNYQKTALSTMYVGKSCWIWFNADGTVEKVVNDFERSGGGSSDSEYNSDFYLIKVKGFADSISEWLKDPIYYIEWKGTSLDEELLADYVEPDDTSVSVYCIGVSDSGVKKQYDYLALDPFIDELTIWSKFGMVTNTFNQFEINLDVIEATMLQDGLTFEGEFYLVPQYKKDSRQYIRGCTTSVNIFTGEVNNIVEEPGEDDVIVPVTPPDDDDDDDPDDSGLPDIGGIGDIPTFMINLIKSFFGFVGYVPNLLGVIFPFLPTEINYLLSLGLVVSVVLRIVGR